MNHWQNLLTLLQIFTHDLIAGVTDFSPKI